MEGWRGANFYVLIFSLSPLECGLELRGSVLFYLVGGLSEIMREVFCFFSLEVFVPLSMQMNCDEI